MKINMKNTEAATTYDGNGSISRWGNKSRLNRISLYYSFCEL